MAYLTYFSIYREKKVSYMFYFAIGNDYAYIICCIIVYPLNVQRLHSKS